MQNLLVKPLIRCSPRKIKKMVQQRENMATSSFLKSFDLLNYSFLWLFLL